MSVHKVAASIILLVLVSPDHLSSYGLSSPSIIFSSTSKSKRLSTHSIFIILRGGGTQTSLLFPATTSQGCQFSRRDNGLPVYYETHTTGPLANLWRSTQSRQSLRRSHQGIICPPPNQCSNLFHLIYVKLVTDRNTQRSSVNSFCKFAKYYLAWNLKSGSRGVEYLVITFQASITQYRSYQRLFEAGNVRQAPKICRNA